MPLKDPEARRLYHREYIRRYLRDPEKRTAQRKRVLKVKAANVAKNAALLAEFRSSGCWSCGETDPVCLEAHHVDPTKKHEHVSHLMGASQKLLRQELAKCVCVCANCHRKIHAGKIAVPSRSAR